MKYLHTMVRVADLEESLRFYRDGLGLEVVRQKESEKGRFTLVYLAAPGQPEAELELTYNWDPRSSIFCAGGNFDGISPIVVEEIFMNYVHHYNVWASTINRPPRRWPHWHLYDSPDGISIELLAKR